MNFNIQLSDGWTLRDEQGNSFEARVPGDISDDLYRAGRLPDPLMGDNYKLCRPIIEKDWDYELVFFLTEEEISCPRLYLLFEGIDTFADVYCNGRLVGESHSMYRACKVDIKKVAIVGKNYLQVRMKSPYRIYDSVKNDKYMSLFHPNRVFFRKPACHFMWDWAPDFPGYGIYLPVWLKGEDEFVLKEVEISPDINGEVRFITKLGFDVRLMKDCNMTLRLTVSEKGGESPVVLESKVDSRFMLQNILVQNPKLWWPRGYGEPNLYQYRLELMSRKKCLSCLEGCFGFRKIELSERMRDSRTSMFAIKVNGREVFCRGSNWIPSSNMTGTLTNEVYENLLTDAHEANYNLLRVWGGGFYEKEIFYKLCDELGIMVWQDFMSACSDLPDDLPEFCEEFKEEADEQIRRLRNHASIVVWCGGNERRRFLDCRGPQYGEYIWEVMLRGLVAQLTQNAVYVPNCPFSRTDVDMDGSSGDQHISCYDPALNDERIADYPEYLEKIQSNFITECAMLGPCRVRSIKKFIPQENIWPPNEIWKEHWMLNPYSLTPDEDFVTKELRMAKGLFGESEGMNDFIKKAMLVHSEIMQAEVEFARSRKECKGFLNWMYNDIWGCGTWSVVDFYGEKKAAFYAQKRAYRPRHVCIVQEKGELFACVINECADALMGSLTCAVKQSDGKLLKEERHEVLVEPFSLVRIPVSVSGEGYTVANLATEGEVFTAFYQPSLRGKMYVSDLLVTRTQEDECHARISIHANAFARIVFLDLPNNSGVVYSDNYFDMEQGSNYIVDISASTPFRVEDVKVLTYADEWTE